MATVNNSAFTATRRVIFVLESAALSGVNFSIFFYFSRVSDSYL